MLEFYFSDGGVLKRLRSGALGGEMDRLAEHFLALGYKRASAKIYLSRIARFRQFAGTRCGPMPIHQDVVDSYLRTFTTDSRIGAVSALGHARRVAPERFIVSVPSEECDPDAPLLASFSDYLHRVRGLEPNTREGVLLGGRRFLDWFRHHHPDQNLEALTAGQVLAAVEHRLSLSATSGSRTAATSHIRTFLRFYIGLVAIKISPASSQECPLGVWRICRLALHGMTFGTRSMQSAQRRRSTSAIEPSCCCSPPRAFATASYAPFGCGISTGVLTGEVFVRRAKGKRDRVVPLLEETGAALADYILRARPKVDSPYLFLSFTLPVGPFKSAAPVSRIVRKRLRHDGVELGGAPVRISCATALLPSLSGSEGQSTRSHSPFRERSNRKLEALAAMAPPSLKPGRFAAPDKLLAMLKSIGRSTNYVE
ncbi:site-specific integrase [Sinorhizobium fredii]|uniref:Integrase/recombinase family protein n=1 Tax=Rhizobium fredii TaxID=380 RepID=A0A2L0HBS2_RHIFR|nr:site-specific integrase [Sinorhizobium fredii]AUX78951.1 integrase/recombinase family protein [Sinorhizobium fredii]